MLKSVEVPPQVVGNDGEFDEGSIDRLELIYEQLDETVKYLERKWIFQLDWFFFYLSTIYCGVDLTQGGLQACRLS